MHGGKTSISSDVIRGYNDTIILSLLLERDSYGYEISREIKRQTGEKYVMKETTLYSAFSRLESSGCIRSYYGTESGGSRRTYYAITEKGRQTYREKCAEWDLTIEVVGKFIMNAERGN